ncbi:hypothetical protein [Lentzea jiangxiensis]|uniref:Uncharacterized protein n=1 Tax=Lentzea jiangxiensis TaxID=641025 RepID=A0A1H0X357_9PSEU|nr:hypothetical protein [Lentzea jiangxiensis]SDP97320.1 hypothetical protein SAMN05421507_13046 [Lentzea jiangxiensis]
MLVYLRYLLAAPFLLTAVVGVPTGYKVLSSYLYRREVRDGTFDWAGEFRDSFTQIAVLWPTALAVVLFTVFWWMTTAWPKIALVPSVPALFGGLIYGLLDGWEHAAAGAAAPVVAFGLAWIAARIVVRPVSGSVRRSAVEVAVGLRGGGRLRIQSRRLLLDRLPAPLHPMSPVGRVALRFDRIRGVEAGVVRTPAQWRLANTSELTITPGPVLRIIGCGQEWLLPVDDADGTARIVSERSRVRATPDPRPPLDSGRWFHAKLLWGLAGQEPPVRNTQKVNHGNRWAALLISALTTPMALYSAYRLFTDGWSYLVGVLVFGVIAWVATHVWFRQGIVYKLTEENPVSPSVDDPDPRRIPVTGWSPQPVTLGQMSDS